MVGGEKVRRREERQEKQEIGLGVGLGGVCQP